MVVSTKVFLNNSSLTPGKLTSNIEKAIGSTSPTEKISQTTYKVEDEEMLKRLYGLK